MTNDRSVSVRRDTGFWLWLIQLLEVLTDDDAVDTYMSVALNDHVRLSFAKHQLSCVDPPSQEVPLTYVNLSTDEARNLIGRLVRLGTDPHAGIGFVLTSRDGFDVRIQLLAVVEEVEHV